jgi:ABC-type transport system substrate-binding protein
MRLLGQFSEFICTNMHLANDPGTCLTFRILNDGHTSFYKDDKLLDLIKKSNVEVDVEKRTNLLKEVALEMNKQHGPHTPIAQVQLNYAADKGIYGMELYASGWFNIKHINFDPNL